jgi:hypothetical protein
MGVDGIQYVSIRGPKTDLDTIEKIGLRFGEHDDACLIGEVMNRDPRYIVFRMDFRNMPIYDEMEILLKRYPKCWIKNSFSTETGDCGMWIGRYNRGTMEIQKLAWHELSHEEIIHEADFSRSFD